MGDKYSSKFDVRFKGALNDGVAFMGCYGIGISRLVSACVEQLGSETKIYLPTCITPYLGVIIPQKEGHRFSESLEVAERIEKRFLKLQNRQDFLFDDRHSLSIGKRLKECQSMGIPLAIVAGKTALEDEPKVEVYWRNFSKPLYICPENDLMQRVQSLLAENNAYLT